MKKVKIGDNVKKLERIRGNDSKRAPIKAPTADDVVMSLAESSILETDKSIENLFHLVGGLINKQMSYIKLIEDLNKEGNNLELAGVAFKARDMLTNTVTKFMSAADKLKFVKTSSRADPDMNIQELIALTHKKAYIDVPGVTVTES